MELTGGSIFINEKIVVLKNYVALKDVGPVPGGTGHQENLRHLKHLVSVSDRGRKKSAVCKKNG